MKKTPFKLPDASVVIATYNNANTLRRVLQGMLKLSYPAKFEVIVVNDGSRDSTREMMKEFAKEKRISFIDFHKNQGVCKARNAGIKAAKHPIVINMDHDCIPERDWLEKMVAGFSDPKVGVVSAYDYYGGTSTGFRKELLERVGGYDEAYRYYREDTDLSFKIMDLGYDFKLVKAGYEHDHVEVTPRGFSAFVRHVLKRLAYHQNDALLWKKHPTAVCAKFLHVKYGFLVDPVQDFRVATGTWQKGGKLSLSSPRGITFLKNSTPLHTLVIVIGGVAYVLAVKASRLIGSIRFGKLLL